MSEGWLVGAAIRATVGLSVIGAMVGGTVQAASWIHRRVHAEAEPPPPPIPPPAPPPTAELERRLTELEQQLHEARVLAAFGGARMRGPKVLRVISCDASFMPGSYGADAYSALRRTGLCDAPERLSRK